MKMFTKILLLTALLAQQTALFATTARIKAEKTKTIEITENPGAAYVWAAFDLNNAENVFATTSAFHCTRSGANGLHIVENIKSGGSSVALKEIKTPNPTLSVFPNPSKGLVKISLSQAGTDIYRVRISNTIGKVVRTIEPGDIKAAGETGVEVDLSNLPAGIYFYSLIVNEKMVETIRLVLQN